ncbi:MAG: hypothetical protein WKG01_28150 [Kofleriaceae bacterium]
MSKRVLRGVLFACAISLGSSGCTVHGQVASGVVVTEPDLVEVSPGVWVVEDADEPTFYSDGYYWRYRDDLWFRSSVHTGGWARYDAAPRVVVGIQSPRMYVRYRHAGRVNARQGPRGRVIVRDHRGRRR